VDPYDPENERRGTILLANAPFGGTPAYTKMYRIYVEDNPNPLVRSAALEALGRHGEPEDAELVAKQLKDKSVQVRMAAAKALQRLHNPKRSRPKWMVLSANRSATKTLVKWVCVS
jgi:HEAT repeat protein